MRFKRVLEAGQDPATGLFLLRMMGVDDRPYELEFDSSTLKACVTAMAVGCRDLRLAVNDAGQVATPAARRHRPSRRSPSPPQLGK